jgi:methylated-DNA-protein-cysteine methyltransferase related protein
MPPRRPIDSKLARRLLKDASQPDLSRDEAMRRVILSIPKGKVATYGQVAAAAGYPLYHRAAAKLLRQSHGDLPWHRVVGAGGEIKTKYEHAQEQRLRLELEGVTFRGNRVALEEHQHVFRLWEF